MPIRLQEDNISIHMSFWTALTKNSDSLALSQLWVCGIDKDQLTRIARQISSQLSRYESNTWNNLVIGGQDDVNSAVLNPVNFTASSTGSTNLYLFANGVSFIADGLNTTRIGSTQTGAMKGLISDSRLELNATNITFLESNVSFVDGLIRPWMALVGHRSLKDQNLRCDIELLCLEKWELNQPLRVRKSMKFKNAIPINVDAVELNYTGDKLIERSVQFAFDRYEVNVYPETTTAGIDTVKFDLRGDQPKETIEPSTDIISEQQKETIAPSVEIQSDKPKESPTLSVKDQRPLRQERTHVIYYKNRNEPNKSPKPKGNVLADEGSSIVSLEDADMILNAEEPNTNPIPPANARPYEPNESPTPLVAKNQEETDISPTPKAVINSNKSDASPVPFVDIHPNQSNKSPVVTANILSTGR